MHAVTAAPPACRLCHRQAARHQLLVRAGPPGRHRQQGHGARQLPTHPCKAVRCGAVARAVTLGVGSLKSSMTPSVSAQHVPVCVPPTGAPAGLSLLTIGSVSPPRTPPPGPCPRALPCASEQYEAFHLKATGCTCGLAPCMSLSLTPASAPRPPPPPEPCAPLPLRPPQQRAARWGA